MKISGKYTLDATREEVWDAHNDIDVLARVVPGCERLDQTHDNEYEGMVKIGIQAIKGTYSGRIRMEDIQAPTHLTLVANGKSANGVVDGRGSVDLEEKDRKTILSYSGDAQIGGVLASVGQRLIEGASRQLINQSLKALAEQIILRRGTTSAARDNGAASAVQQNASVTQMSTQPPMSDSNNAPIEAASGADVAVTSALFPGTASTAAAGAASGTQAPARVNASPTQMAAQQPMLDQNNLAGSMTAQPSSPRRSVVVPEHEQLKPESIISGMLSDMHGERPWLVWVVLAAVIGYLLGRSRQ